MEEERVQGLNRIPRPISRKGMESLIVIFTELGFTAKEMAFLLRSTPATIYGIRREVRRREQPQDAPTRETAKAG